MTSQHNGPDQEAISREEDERDKGREELDGYTEKDWLTAENEFNGVGAERAALEAPESEAPEYAEVIPLGGESDPPREDQTKAD